MKRYASSAASSAKSVTPTKRPFQLPRKSINPPSGGPIVTPRFAATRTDAYAAS
jgi:hypothetical protein